MNKSSFVFLLSLLFPVCSVAQSTHSVTENPVSLEEALEIALENNHNIKVARRSVEVSENNATLGNAGFLPSVTASGSYSGSIQNSQLQFPGNTPPDQNVEAARSNTLNGSLNANYVLFDGFGNYYTFQSLQKLEEQAGVQARLEIEGTLLQVISIYLSAMLEHETVLIAQESVERSVERLQRVQQRYNLGNVTRLQVLTARVDLNSDSVSYVQAQNRFENAKRNLLIELGISPTAEIELGRELEISTNLQLSELLSNSRSKSASLVLSRINAENAALQLKQNRSGRFPVVSLNGSYSYNRNEAEAGQFEFLQTDGFSGGISVSLNLFDGFRQENRIQNAQVALKNNEELLQLTEKSVERDVMNTYENYQTNLFLLNKELLNLETAMLNFKRAEELYALGQLTNTQLREAQLNVSAVQQNIVRLKIQAKLSEVQLLQLAGELITVSDL